jgi:hypothetical protein
MTFSFDICFACLIEKDLRDKFLNILLNIYCYLLEFYYFLFSNFDILTYFSFRFVAIVCILPIISCFAMHLKIGRTMEGLTLGIVNNEISSIEDCSVISLPPPDTSELFCFIDKISCRFVNEIDENLLKKVEKSFLIYS